MGSKSKLKDDPKHIEKMARKAAQRTAVREAVVKCRQGMDDPHAIVGFRLQTQEEVAREREVRRQAAATAGIHYGDPCAFCGEAFVDGGRTVDCPGIQPEESSHSRYPAEEGQRESMSLVDAYSAYRAGLDAIKGRQQP